MGRRRDQSVSWASADREWKLPKMVWKIRCHWLVGQSQKDRSYCWARAHHVWPTAHTRYCIRFFTGGQTTHYQVPLEGSCGASNHRTNQLEGRSTSGMLRFSGVQRKELLGMVITSVPLRGLFFSNRRCRILFIDCRSWRFMESELLSFVWSVQVLIHAAPRSNSVFDMPSPWTAAGFHVCW